MELQKQLEDLGCGVVKTLVMLQVLIDDYPIPAISIITKAKEYEILGEDLYRLYELSSKDFYLMQYLIYRVPTELLIKTCTKTGSIKDIKEYINTYTG